MTRRFCSVLFIKYSGDQMKNEMDWECGTCGGQECCIRGLVGRFDGKRPLGRRPRRRWKDNIKMDLEVGLGSVDWIDLAVQRDRWRAVVSAVVNLRVEICAVLGYYASSSGNFLPTFRCLSGFLIPEDGTHGHLTFHKRLTCALE
jgi:hypothetical protein